MLKVKHVNILCKNKATTCYSLTGLNKKKFEKLKIEELQVLHYKSPSKICYCNIQNTLK